MTEKEANYLNLRDELSAIVDALQAGDLDIDEATQAYERGMELIAQLEEHLQTVENKITKLKVRFDAGQKKT